MVQVTTNTTYIQDKTPALGNAKNALSLLKADHELVKGLFAQYEKARTDNQKGALAERICTELTVHAQIEEEIFYPAIRKAIADQNLQDLMDEADVEHSGAKDLIAQIRDSWPGDEYFDARVTVLGEYVKHHIKEEHSKMFPKVRKTNLDLFRLGAALEERKGQLQNMQ